MTDTQSNSLVERLAARFGDLLAVTVARNEVTAELAGSDLIAVATALRDTRRARTHSIAMNYLHCAKCAIQQIVHMFLRANVVGQLVPI